MAKIVLAKLDEEEEDAEPKRLRVPMVLMDADAKNAKSEANYQRFKQNLSSQWREPLGIMGGLPSEHREQPTSGKGISYEERVERLRNAWRSK